MRHGRGVGTEPTPGYKTGDRTFDTTGWTPLHFAACGYINAPFTNGRQSGARAVNILLENGANRHITSQDGKTPAGLARELGFDDVATVLEN